MICTIATHQLSNCCCNDSILCDLCGDEVFGEFNGKLNSSSHGVREDETPPVSATAFSSAFFNKVTVELVLLVPVVFICFCFCFFGLNGKGEERSEGRPGRRRMVCKVRKYKTLLFT